MKIKDLMEFAQKNNASDIHLSATKPPMLRIYGDISHLRVPPLSTEEVYKMLYEIMNEEQRTEYKEEMDLDFAVEAFGNRYRVNAFQTVNGPAAALRAVPKHVLSLEELGAPESLAAITGIAKGLILVTGPTGSGKSTTVAAMVDHINQQQKKHIITIEDPIEFVHKSNKALINQREIGIHSKSFRRALKSALREDPDIIMVGELRDVETIHSALIAAETGHLVIATLHTSSAAQTIDRIIDVFSSEEKEMIRTMLSNSIEAVISQRLIRKVDGSGRLPAFEILIANSAIRNLIREAKIPQINSAIQVGKNLGMCLMRESVEELLANKLISKESAKQAIITSEEQALQSKKDNFGMEENF